MFKSDIYRRPRRASAATLATVVLMLTATAGAQQSMPITIEADTAELSRQDGVSTYTGDVVLTRGGLTLTGSKLVVSRIGSDGAIRAELTGSPATLDKQPEGEEDAQRVTGHADRMIYTNSNATVVLRGDAMVERGGDVIRSELIRHYLDSQRTEAEGAPGGDGRVRITIHPEENGGPSAQP